MRENKVYQPVTMMEFFVGELDTVGIKINKITQEIKIQGKEIRTKDR